MTEPEYPRRKADGWPLCPGCGDDELWSAAVPATVETIVSCLGCGWKPGYYRITAAGRGGTCVKRLVCSECVSNVRRTGFNVHEGDICCVHGWVQGVEMIPVGLIREAVEELRVARPLLRDWDVEALLARIEAMIGSA